MKSISIPGSCSSVNTGDVITILKYGPTKWIADYGFYTHTGQLLEGWYITSIPDGNVVPLSYDDLIGSAKVSNDIQDSSCNPRPPAPKPHQKPVPQIYKSGMQIYGGQLIYLDTGRIYQADISFRSSCMYQTARQNMEADIAAKYLVPISSDVVGRLQSNWEEEDDTSQQYIQNKPNIVVHTFEYPPEIVFQDAESFFHAINGLGFPGDCVFIGKASIKGVPNHPDGVYGQFQVQQTAVGETIKNYHAIYLPNVESNKRYQASHSFYAGGDSGYSWEGISLDVELKFISDNMVTNSSKLGNPAEVVIIGGNPNDITTSGISIESVLTDVSTLDCGEFTT